QPAPLIRHLKHPLTQGGTIERAILLQYRITEAINDLLQRRPARLHHHPGLDVRIHHMNAMRLLKPRRRSTFATANAAGQTHDEFERRAHQKRRLANESRPPVYGE